MARREGNLGVVEWLKGEIGVKNPPHSRLLRPFKGCSPSFLQLPGERGVTAHDVLTRF